MKEKYNKNKHIVPFTKTHTFPFYFKVILFIAHPKSLHYTSIVSDHITSKYYLCLYMIKVFKIMLFFFHLFLSENIFLLVSLLIYSLSISS